MLQSCTCMSKRPTFIWPSALTLISVDASKQPGPPLATSSPSEATARSSCCHGSPNSRKKVVSADLPVPYRCLVRRRSSPICPIWCMADFYAREDNQACITIARKGFSSKIRSFVKTHIELSHAGTDCQRNDPLTKPLTVQK